MNAYKPLIIFFSTLIFLTACSIHRDHQTTSKGSETAPNSKKSSMRRHHLPDGVISADIINDHGRLHLLTGHHEKGNKRLWHQFSDNDGVTWSEAVLVLGDKNLQVNMERGKDAQITAIGNTVVAAWMKFDPNARFHAGPMIAARSEDHGKTWQYSATPPDWQQGPHGYIDLASDTSTMHAVWLDSRLGKSEVNASQTLQYAYSEDKGKTWQKNQTLDKLTCSCCWNTVKTDSQKKAYVLYRDKQPSDFSLGVVDTTQNWKRLSTVGDFNWQFEGCPHIGGGLDFQSTNSGMLIHAVVGTGQTEHTGVHYLYSEDQGETWSKALKLGDDSAIHSDVASHDDGRVIAVWDMLDKKNLAIFAAESNDNGKTWQMLGRLSDSGQRATHPRIVKTDSGFFILWTSHNGNIQSLHTRRM